MNPSLPQRKVGVGLAAGAATSLAMWALKQFADITIDAETALALYTLGLFVLQYAVPNAEVS